MCSSDLFPSHDNQQRNCVDIKTRSHYMQFVRRVKVILFSANTADLQKMGNRSTVGRRTLTPSIKVRILVPQPNKIKHLQALNLASGLRLSVIVINL